MEFQILDSFFYMKENEVEEKYRSKFDKHIFKGGDSDHYLVVILDQFHDKPNLFTDLEVKFLSTLIDIRRNGGYVTFKGVYSIIKNLILTIGSPSRDENVNNIMALLKGGNSNAITISNDISNSMETSSPTIKYVRTFHSLSPSLDCGNISTSYKPEIVFGWVNAEH